jgi:hypothetical protein
VRGRDHRPLPEVVGWSAVRQNVIEGKRLPKRVRDRAMLKLGGIEPDWRSVDPNRCPE